MPRVVLGLSGWVIGRSEGKHGFGSGGGTAFWRFVYQGIADGVSRSGETRGGGDDFGGNAGDGGRRGRCGAGERLKKVGGRNVRVVEGVALIEHPAGKHGLGGLLNPLVDQGADFAPKVGGVIESAELEALQGSGRCLSKILQRRNDSG